MKRTFITALLIVFGTQFSFGSDWIRINSDKPEQAEISLVFSNIEKSELQFRINGFYLNPVKTPRGAESIVKIPEGTQMLEKGAPDLPKLTSSVIIPDLEGMEIKVVDASYTDYHNIAIAPSKGNFTRDIDPATVPYTYGEAYNNNSFFPGKLAELRDPYIVRDYRGQTAVIYPFQYNPVSKTLRVYQEITIVIFAKNNNGINPLVRTKELKTIDVEFNKLYQHQFINASSVKYDPVDEQGEMLIISYGEFMDAMAPFIEWKNMSGIPATIVDVATIGSSSGDIKSYIADYYNENDLAFVLLVGDAAQVPSSYSSGDSDNDYSYVVGSDHYPDLFIGRFSAENVEQVEVQVERTIEYEKNPYTTTDWFTKGIGIASSQGPGHNNEMDYEHVRVIHEKLLDFTYTYCSELFDGSQGGLDEPGNPNPSMVAEDVNEGASIINYTGHGSTSSWGSSGFSSNDVNQLTNNGMYPFIWSVACVNGNFVGSTCFAEAWLRATHEGEPSGGVATMMSTINQSWDPPMCGQDEMNDILVESYENNIKRTFGGISMNGCMLMNDEFGGGGYSMTDTWTCFGDPSLMVRTVMPQDIAAEYNQTVFIGADQLSVTTNTTEGLICLSQDGEIIATATIVDGEALLEFEALNDVGMFDLVITAFNYIPHVGQLEVIPADGPYVVYHQSSINDELGNNNGMADYGETVMLSLSLENIGIEDASNVEVSLETDNEYVNITVFEALYDNIPQGETVTHEDAFTIELSQDIPDLDEIKFDLTAVSGDDTWTGSFYITAHAPVLSFLQYTINDEEGNNNGIFDPGETVEANISIENNGTASAMEISGLLETTHPQVSIEEAQLNYGSILPGESAVQAYILNSEPEVTQGSYALFSFTYFLSGEQINIHDFEIRIGHPQVLILDLDETPVTGSAINEILNNKGLSTDYFTEFPDEISENYRLAFVCLGVYPKNYVLETSEGQTLANFIESGGMIYMEGGDTWYYDQQTAVHALFNINALDDGNGDLGTINGMESSFSEGMSFAYDGETNYTDQIAANGDAIDIFSNEAPEYVCAVANSTDTYKTIGTSFEFGGLTDGENTKEELLEKYLEFFNMTAPPKPQQAYGIQEMCSGGSEETEYIIPCLDGIEMYQWVLSPETAGEISGNDTIATVSWNSEFSGEARVKVCGINEMGMGPMSDPLNIVIYPLPEISLGADTSICFYHSLEILAEGEFVTYEWMDGSTGNSITIDSTFGGAGTLVPVTLTVTDTNGCSGEAMLNISIEECAGIGETLAGNLISLYPNPSSGMVYLDYPADKIRVERLDVYNSFGSLVLQLENLNSENKGINLQKPLKGIYFINIYTDRGIAVKKLVIE